MFEAQIRLTDLQQHLPSSDVTRGVLCCLIQTYYQPPLADFFIWRALLATIWNRHTFYDLVNAVVRKTRFRRFNHVVVEVPREGCFETY